MQISVLSDEYYMKQALKEAELALEAEEIPIGAVVVCNDKIIARAIENQAYYIGVNRMGDDPEGIHYSGFSQVINAKGELISKAKPDQETVKSCVLDYDNLQSFRKKFPVGKDWDPFQQHTHKKKQP